MNGHVEKFWQTVLSDSIYTVICYGDGHRVVEVKNTELMKICQNFLMSKLCVCT